VPEFKAAGGFEPETYMKYFEDSNPTPNAEIGCKMPFLDGHGGPWVLLGRSRCLRFITGAGTMNPGLGRKSIFMTCRRCTII
jgi:hypothetical protein